MSDQYSNNKTRFFIIAAVGTLVLPISAYADETLSAALEKCSVIKSDEDRLNCYDALALLYDSVVVARPAPASETAPAPVPETAPAPVPETAPAPAPEAAPVPVPAEPTVAVAAAAESAPEVLPLGGDIGQTGVKKDESEPQKYSAKVTSCVEHKQSGQYYFYFDNGQVWKQSNYQKLRWRECEFDVTIAKATFGYDMYIPEKDRTVRVSRLR